MSKTVTVIITINVTITVTVTVTFNKLLISKNIMVRNQKVFLHWNQHKLRVLKCEYFDFYQITCLNYCVEWKIEQIEQQE